MADLNDAIKLAIESAGEPKKSVVLLVPVDVDSLQIVDCGLTVSPPNLHAL